MKLSVRPVGRFVLVGAMLGVIAVTVPQAQAAAPAEQLRPGQVVVVAGSGAPGYAGDGFTATDARIGERVALSVGPDGTVYLADRSYRRVRVVSPAGKIDTIPGTVGHRSKENEVDVAPGWTYNPVDAPVATMVGPDGALYIARDSTVGRIEKDGTRTLLGGGAVLGPDDRGDGGPATSAEFGSIADLAVDASGTIFVADHYDARIRRIAADGTITTVAGGGTVPPANAGGQPATALNLAGAKGFGGPTSVVVDKSGNLYFPLFEELAKNPVPGIGKVTPDGTFSIVAGGLPAGFSGDGGPATSAQLGGVQTLDVDAEGNLYFIDTGYAVIRMVTPDGTISTVGPASGTSDIAVGPDGDLYTTGGAKVHRLVRHGSTPKDKQPAERADRWADRAPGTAVTVAGTGYEPPEPEEEVVRDDGGPGPTGVAVGPDGTVYYVDESRNRVGKVTKDGTELVAGTGKYGEEGEGDGGPAKDAALAFPSGVAVGPDGTVDIADNRNGVVRTVGKDGTIETVEGSSKAPPRWIARLGDTRYVTVDDGVAKLDASGAVTTVAGGGERYADEADGHPATETYLYNPTALAVAPDGTVYFAEDDRAAVRAVGPDGILRTVAGDSYRQAEEGAFSGDGGPATAAEINSPGGLAVGADGSLYIADTFNNRIRRVTPDGIITTVAGTGERTQKGDGGAAKKAALLDPTGIAVDEDGNVYVTSQPGGSIRKVAADGTISTIARFGENAAEQPATKVAIGNVNSMTVDRAGTMYYSGTGTRVFAVGADGVARGLDVTGSSIATGPDGSLYTSPTGGLDRRYPDGPTVPVNGYGVVKEPFEPGQPALTADIRIKDVAVAPNGELYVLGAGHVFRIGLDGTLTTVTKYLGTAIAIGPDGAIYLTDFERNQVHRYAHGELTVFAGSGAAYLTDGDNGDGGPATEAVVSYPRDMAIAPDGTMYLSEDSGIRRIDPDGEINTILPPAVNPVDSDTTYEATDLALDPHGNLYYAESFAFRVRVLVRPGEIVLPGFGWSTMLLGLDIALVVGFALLAFGYRRRLLALLPNGSGVPDVSGRNTQRWSMAG